MSILDHARTTKMVKLESFILAWITPAATIVFPQVYAEHVCNKIRWSSTSIKMNRRKYKRHLALRYHFS